MTDINNYHENIKLFKQTFDSALILKNNYMNIFKYLPAKALVYLLWLLPSCP